MTTFARQDRLRYVVVPANLVVARQDGLLRYAVDPANLVVARQDGLLRYLLILLSLLEPVLTGDLN